MKAPAQKNLRRALLGLVVVVIVGLLAWSELRTDGLGDGFASGNGRIEATEIDVATKLGGRIREISVDEGDFVQPGQIIARMDTEVLEAQLNQARAQVRQAENAILTVQALVAQRERKGHRRSRGAPAPRRTDGRAEALPAHRGPGRAQRLAAPAAGR